jgi:protein-S-isoprenylcysteine O-methyltransferase Ste14
MFCVLDIFYIFIPAIKCLLAINLNQTCMNKLNFLGIGPKIASILLPYLVLSIVLSTHNHKFGFLQYKTPFMFNAGIVVLVAGLIFYIFTVRLLVKGLNETRLITTGPYSLCQNPLYASIVLLMIPGLSLILNSWLILTSSVVGYVMFRLFIKSEYRELEKFFGEQYRKYSEVTPEFFPLPFKKWFS